VSSAGPGAIPRESADVAIVGGGPAGLGAAAALAGSDAGRVVVLEREAAAGGIPRHARHQGFGLRDVGRSLSGPAYAERIVERAVARGAELRLETQATGWSVDGALELTSPGGRSLLAARAVVLATGCRERPRSARLVPGTRPQGVMTTGMLQQLVYLRGEAPGRAAVVVGAEHVSFSALLTLAHGGARAAAMVTEHARHQSLAAFRLGAAARFRVPFLTRTRVSAVNGRRRVESVELTDLRSGATRIVPCDLVVFTADWIPDHELAVLAGAALDAGTRGPAVDPALRTTRPGLFAAGNVLHGAEVADVAALAGRHVARAVAAYLDDGSWPAERVPIECSAPLDWISPSAVAAGGGVRPKPPRGRFLLRASEPIRLPRIEIEQGGRRLWRARVRRVGPGRSTSLPAGWAAAVDPHRGPVTVAVR
jgi:thioredoxin reductase